MTNKFRVLFFVIALLMCLSACDANTDTAELTNEGKYTYNVSATFYVPLSGSGLGEASISAPMLSKPADEYCADFTKVLENGKILSVLRQYGFSSYHNVEITNIGETEIFKITFYSNEKETIAEMATKICELLPETISEEYGLNIKFVDYPSISGIRKSGDKE